ncbi:MAG: hypothetical protein AAF645_13985, partial [Myxococcota bacterium]
MSPRIYGLVLLFAYVGTFAYGSRAAAQPATAPPSSPPADQSGATRRPLAQGPLEETPRGPAVLRMEGGIQLAFGGQVEANVPTGSTSSAALRTGGGVYVRGDIRLNRLLFVRPAFRWRSVGADGLGERVNHFALSFALGLSRIYDFRPGPSTELEVLATAALGIAAVDEILVFDNIDVSPDPFTESQTEFGVHIAVAAGFIVWMHRRVGLTFTAGYERGEFFPDRMT